MDFAEIPVYELYDLWYRPFWKTSWFIILSCSLITILIIISTWYIYKKIIERRDEEQPWRSALDKLSKINVLVFDDPAQHKLFYTQLIDIIRSYFMRRYSLDLKGKTDQEMLKIFRTLSIEKDLYESIYAVVLGAEAIKFASKMSVVEHMQYDLKRVQKIVHATIPKS